MLSVAVLVIVVSVVNGFERELRERVMGVLPHIVAESYGGLRAAEIDKFLQQGPHAGMASVAPYVSGTALLAANGRIHGASLTGVDPASYAAVTDLPKYTSLGGLGTLNEER